MTRLFRAETAFFLLIWLLLLLTFRERGFYDPGSLWHVKVGEIILNEGMPQTDPFSYTFEDHRWVPQQWGAEVLMAITHRIGGFDAMLLAFATGVALLFTLIFRRCMQSGMGPVLAALIVGVCLFVGTFHYYVRPHMFTIALLGWTMMCIVDYERGRCSEWRLAGLIPLYVLWTNLHGGVLGGTMTLGLAVAGWGALFLLNRWRTPTVREGVDLASGEPEELASGEKAHPLPDGQSGALSSRRGACPQAGQGSGCPERSPIQSWRTAFILVAIVIACGLTPFINPHGMEMIRIWQRIVGSTVLPKIITEHMPLDPTSPLGMGVLGLGAFYIVLLAGTIVRTEGEKTGANARTSLPRVSWVIPLVWLVLSFKGIRQGPLFAIVAAVAIADFWPHTIWHQLLVKYGDGSLARTPTPNSGCQVAWAIIPAAVVLLALGLQVGKVSVPVIGYGWAQFDPKIVPVDLNKEVAAYASAVPPGTRIFNDANFGGYLIYYAPSLKIFMDDRCELYGDDWMKRYTDTLGLPPDKLGVEFEQWQAKYHFDRALIMISPTSPKKPMIEQYLLSHPEKWKEVARGQRAAMFERVK
jgi:hypothetical protein